MKILLFGILADVAGERERSLSLREILRPEVAHSPEQPNHSTDTSTSDTPTSAWSPTVRDVWESLVQRIPPLSQWVAQNPSAVRAIAVAINEEYTQWEDVVQEGDEIAFLPPVAGGQETFCPPVDAELPYVALTPLVLSGDPLTQMVSHPDNGAVALFAGTVREFTGPERKRTVLLEYEAYPSMAERVLRAIAQDVTTRWRGARVAIVHRVGALLPGDVSVIVVVGTPHRADAFEACRHAIERLKVEVPIWKKEHGEDGTVWVGWQGA